MNQIGIFGANGRMGRALLEVVSKDENSELIAFCRKGSEHIGTDLSATVLGAKGSIILQDETTADNNIDVLIDFTLPLGLKIHLADAIKKVLNSSIKSGGSSINDYVNIDGEMGYFQHHFNVYGKENDQCLSCMDKSRIKKIVQSGRSTFFCSKCQK